MIAGALYFASNMRLFSMNDVRPRKKSDDDVKVGLLSLSPVASEGVIVTVFEGVIVEVFVTVLVGVIVGVNDEVIEGVTEGVVVNVFEGVLVGVKD